MKGGQRERKRDSSRFYVQLRSKTKTLGSGSSTLNPIHRNVLLCVKCSLIISKLFRVISILLLLGWMIPKKKKKFMLNLKKRSRQKDETT